MHLYSFPDQYQISKFCERKGFDYKALLPLVKQVFDLVESKGLQGVMEYAQLFDQSSFDDPFLPEEQWNQADTLVDPSLKTAINLAADNIKKFHESQIGVEEPVETMPGVTCFRRSVPIQRVGLYVPGGSAPLFSSVLMLGIPANLAGVPEIVLCTPSDKEGQVHPAIVYSARLCGIKKIYRLGGIQAIAAMALGFEGLKPVYKLFGPGNSYVTAAKLYAQNMGIAIDMPAGPSEVAIIADESASADFVAADLIAQAEHGPDSMVILITDSPFLIKEVQEALNRQLENLPRAPIVKESLSKSAIVLVNTLQEAVAVSNAFAPEHLLLQIHNPETYLPLITEAGSVFLGHLSPESLGDYASGTNHTLPTSGFARAYSGVSVDSFVKKITYQSVNEQGLTNLGPSVVTMARAEGLEGHARAILIRNSRKL